MKYIVEIGNGYKLVGPFDTKAEADAYVEEHQFSKRWSGFSFNVHRLETPAPVIA